MSKITIKTLGPDDALVLAPLIAEYAQALKRGAPRRPDQFYAERILGDRTGEVIGAELDGRLVGFAIFFDLPEIITGLRVGQLDEIYVHPDARNNGVGRRMVEWLIGEGGRRHWAELRWIVPGKNAPAMALYDKIAEPADWKGYVLPIDRGASA
ncbi:GNAT family N-acetyltransferase [Stappia sp.]|jgi:GNAT superfamily N-acetyltransferase|uniref:GNAT family N-acetyltransferase n=1 Tax=Stappia sp. TaxID=1870903 RepID=UPI003A992C3E